ncbi:hypothetical protein [Streptomyces sp. A1547]|uniref:hypothetical protein n=1 Tax=Streptomyces sp. A1547 TaxID=2563105 RepID=UPI00109EBAB3|nr:hypothetical protein [Streptomyces sp. A1547]THA36974.1 hypothetical protein E6W17_23365 [Streptomyces sp. A1547]
MSSPKPADQPAARRPKNSGAPAGNARKSPTPAPQGGPQPKGSPQSNGGPRPGGGDRRRRRRPAAPGKPAPGAPVPAPRSPGTAGGAAAQAAPAAPPSTADQDAPFVRTRLFARLAGAVLTGLQLLPGTDSLHPGLRVSAIVLLVLDVLTETGSKASAARRRLKDWAATNDLAHVTLAQVLRHLPSAPKLRITVRGVSVAMLALQWNDQLEDWHTGFLVTAVTVLLLDLSTQVFGNLVRRIRSGIGPDSDPDGTPAADDAGGDTPNR